MEFGIARQASVLSRLNHPRYQVMSEMRVTNLITRPLIPEPYKSEHPTVSTHAVRMRMAIALRNGTGGTGGFDHNLLVLSKTSPLTLKILNP